jgi:DNA-binding protein YbaB
MNPFGNIGGQNMKKMLDTARKQMEDLQERLDAARFEARRAAAWSRRS